MAQLAQSDVSQVIDWKTRQALGSGPPGFSLDLGDSEHQFDDWEMEDDSSDLEPLEMPGNRLSLMDAVDQFASCLGEDDTADIELEKKFENNEFLQATTRNEMFRRLLQAGKTEQELEKRFTGTSSMTDLAGYLYSVEHPWEKQRARIKAFIFTGFRGTDKITPVYLPPDITFLELNLQLRELVGSKAEAQSKPVTVADDTSFLDSWRYKVCRSSTATHTWLDSSWTNLTNILVYRKMVKRVKASDSQDLVPVLCPAKPYVKPGKTSQNPVATEAGSTIHSDGQISASTAVWSPRKMVDLAKGRGKPDLVPEAMEELLEGTEPVNWTELARRIEAGENVFGEE